MTEVSLRVIIPERASEARAPLNVYLRLDSSLHKGSLGLHIRVPFQLAITV